LCCHARDYFALTSFKVPWIYLGMSAGMFFACGLARVLARRKSSRK
jgi:hypothetical protein